MIRVRAGRLESVEGVEMAQAGSYAFTRVGARRV